MVNESDKVVSGDAHDAGDVCEGALRDVSLSGEVAMNDQANAEKQSETGEGKRGRGRSYAWGVVMDTLRRRSALVGLLWLVLVGVFAVFSPVLANSAPVLMKTEAGVSSPLVKMLTAVDVILLVMFLVTGLMWFGGRLGVLVSAGRRVVVWLGVLVLVMGVSFATIEPPRIVDYGKWRAMDAAGEIEWAVYAPIRYSPTDRLAGQARKAPTGEHWFGTEANGSDVLSRIIHACRIAMAIGFIATGISLVIGVVLGGLMGYFSGVVDMIGMRLVEIFEAIPTLFLLLICVAFFGRNLYVMMAIIGLVGWPGYCRFIRAEFLKLRQQDFVHAARACGLPLRSILFRHMLPNGVAPVLVSASFGIASAILAEATLSFLGLGLVEEPSWGQMLNQSLSSAGTFEWWIALYPGLAIFLTVFAYNLIGESLRDAIDPYLNRG